LFSVAPRRLLSCLLWRGRWEHGWVVHRKESLSYIAKVLFHPVTPHSKSAEITGDLAGKGRSGTMACAYLVALHDEPTPSIVRRSHTEKEWVGQRVKETIDALPEDQGLHEATNELSPSLISLLPQNQPLVAPFLLHHRVA
jgi:hypothetical protein